VASRLSDVYRLTVTASRSAVLIAIAALIALHIFGVELSLSWQISIALLGIALGIPHGAIDHLISIPSHPRKKFFAYIVGYVLIAIAAGVAIASWNLIAFDCVLIMSGLHFGFGDASFINEYRISENVSSEPLWVEAMYAIPAGFLPVILPLTDHRTISALERIRHSLIHWSGTSTHSLRTSVLAIAVLSFATLLLTRRYALAIDIALLAALSTFAPPLLAFATYFGFWHAQRHTARLVPRLPKALNLAQAGAPGRAFLSAVTPGLYAVAGSFALAATLMAASPKKFSSSLLWSVLVIVWALTVPHMLSTARLDRASLKGTFRPR
jgi:Brp/Blh family beta-carotene 15,15'-monooxygenase